MVVNAVCFVAGVCCLVGVESLPDIKWLLPVATVTALLVRKTPPLLFLIFGFVAASLHATGVISKRLPAEFLNTEVMVRGSVTGLPQDNGTRRRFMLRLATVTNNETNRAHQANGALVRLNWYGKSPDLRPADNVVLAVKLKTPGGFMNPGGFDYEKWLFQQRIVATGYVRSKDLEGIYDPAPHAAGLVKARLERARGWLQQRLLAATDGYSGSGLILALAVGDRSGIDPQQWQRYIATGTNHLLAISGLHISLVAAAAGMFARTVWGRHEALRRVSRNSVALYAAAASALIYSAMAGFSLPTQRALIMFGVLVLLVITRRHQQRQSALATALIVVCVVNPLAVMAPGFWMSFAAVAILFLVYSFVPQTDWRNRITTVLRGHFLITVGLYPLTLLIFQKASIVAPLANFIAVPLVGLVLTPVVFVASIVACLSIDAARVVLLPVDWVLFGVDRLFALLAELPMAFVHFGDLPTLAIALALVASVVCVLPIHKTLRWLALLLLLPVIASPSSRPDTGAFRLTFLDVGQGTSVVVQTANHTLVYDTGPQFSSTFNAADAVILPYLHALRIKQVDALIVSHADIDHSGGAGELVAGVNVAQSMVSAPIDELPNAHACRKGQQWIWDGVTFRILAPGYSDRGSENDLSCVLLISTASGKHALLPGDIEKSGELRLIREQLPVIDVLMAPHHGSNTSSGKSFIDATRPRHVVYTTGFANRYGFPKSKVSDRYKLAGALEFNTAESGAVSFELNDNRPVSVSEFRPRGGGFWGRDKNPLSPRTATL